MVVFRPPQNPFSSISTPKIGGGGGVKTHFCPQKRAEILIARLLAPYAQILADYPKHVWYREILMFWVPRGAILALFWHFLGPDTPV